MKRIMILGASDNQVPLIIAAKKMGLETHVVSIPGNYPGFGVADVQHYVNTTDKEKILDIAKINSIDGIVTTGTDVAVRSIGYVNSELRLNGITAKAAENVTDKANMKRAFCRNGVRTAEFRVAYSEEDVMAFAEKYGYPIMIKAVDQAASKGILRVDNSDSIKDALEQVSMWSDKPYFVVERFICGEEIGLDGYIDSSEECSIFLHNKIVFNNGMTNVPIGHSIPFRNANTDIVNDIVDTAKKAAISVGLESCFFNMDIIICDDKAYALEIGGRTGSTCIPELLSKYTGIDFYEEMIRNALYGDVRLEYTPQCACAAGFIISKKNGIIQSIDLDSSILSSCDYFDLSVNVGDKVKRFIYGSDGIGKMVCCSDTITNAEKKYYSFQAEIEKGICIN